MEFQMSGKFPEKKRQDYEHSAMKNNKNLLKTAYWYTEMW